MLHALRSPTSILAAVVALGGLAASVHAAAFTPGNVVVSRVGDGTGTLAATATAVFLDEYTPAGALVQSIAMPTAASGGNFILTTAGNSTSQTQLQLSPDNTTLSLIGYNAVPGATITTTVASTVNRIVGLIKNDGTPNTTTNINTTTTGASVRSAITDGTNVWFTTDAKGVEFITAGTAGAPTQLSTSNPVNTRVVGISGGQLYVSSAATSIFGVSTIGTGEPTTTGQTVTELPGMPTSSASPYDFYFADSSNLFVADDNSTGGVQHWNFDGSVWNLLYSLNPGSVGFRSIAGTNSGGALTMYAIGTDNKLYSITDTVADTTGATATLNAIATAGTNTAFRGVDFAPTAAVPEPASLALLGIGAAALLTRRRK